MNLVQTKTMYHHNLAHFTRRIEAAGGQVLGWEAWGGCGTILVTYTEGP